MTLKESERIYKKDFYCSRFLLMREGTIGYLGTRELEEQWDIQEIESCISALMSKSTAVYLLVRVYYDLMMIIDHVNVTNSQVEKIIIATKLVNERITEIDKLIFAGYIYGYNGYGSFARSVIQIAIKLGMRDIAIEFLYIAEKIICQGLYLESDSKLMTKKYEDISTYCKKAHKELEITD